MIVIFIFLLVIVLGILIFLIAYYATLFFGAPYVPSEDKAIRKFAEVTDIKSGEKCADLGAGNGKVIIALAKKGVESHGYEINPFLVWTAKRNIRKARVENKAFMHWKSFWKEDFSSFGIIYVYGFPHIMKKLGVKLRKSLKPGTKVVSSAFSFPNWQYEKKDGATFLYVQKKRIRLR